MMRFQQLLTPIFLVAATLATPILATGCVASASGEIVVDEPPPPREEAIVVRPGFVWVRGNWFRSGNTWAWRGGRYERERAGHRWVEGRWEPRGRGRVWVEGRWD